MKGLSISVKEFKQLLSSSHPPNGWGNTIAVAHSGGADSTCLLYLLHRLISESPGANGFPRELLALSVDHSLQSGSAASAEQCGKFAASLKIPHLTLRIPWGRPPFPDLPVATRPYESVARAARYRVLIEAMKKSGATVMAMGHHADDHVETLLMRLARVKTSDTTPTGMRNCRRWGMGTRVDGLDWAGAAGMHRWIVRPLLGLPKERILATCELNGLRYVQDPTNFQPSLTPRNYVRHCLSNMSHLGINYRDSAVKPENEPLFMEGLDGAIQRLNDLATEVPGLSKGAPNADRLYAVANHIRQLCDDTDKKVTQYLHKFTRPSPPSTLCLMQPPHDLSLPPETRRAIILRILRFISPRPWGSPFSEASRRTSSLDLICDTLWPPSRDVKKPFSAGSEVIWRPVSLRDDGSIKPMVENCHTLQLHGWVASRQPPMKRTGDSSPCIRDISEILSSESSRELLWDNRFLLKIQASLLPSEILDSCKSSGSVIVLPYGKWLLPKIVWRRNGYDDLLLGSVVFGDKRVSLPHILNPNWVEFQWIRSLNAI